MTTLMLGHKITLFRMVNLKFRMVHLKFHKTYCSIEEISVVEPFAFLPLPINIGFSIYVNE